MHKIKVNFVASFQPTKGADETIDLLTNPFKSVSGGRGGVDLLSSETEKTLRTGLQCE